MGYEIDSQRPKLLQRENQLFDAPRKSVKSPNNNHVEQTTARFGHKSIEAQAFLFSTARSVRVELLELPTALEYQVPKRLLLHFEVLDEVDRLALFGSCSSRDAYVARYPRSHLARG